MIVRLTDSAGNTAVANCGGKGGKPGPCSKAAHKSTLVAVEHKFEKAGSNIDAEYVLKSSTHALSAADSKRGGMAAQFHRETADLHRRAAVHEDKLGYRQAADVHKVAAEAHDKAHASHKGLTQNADSVSVNCGGEGGKPGPCPSGGGGAEAALSFSKSALKMTKALDSSPKSGVTGRANSVGWMTGVITKSSQDAVKHANSAITGTSGPMKVDPITAHHWAADKHKEASAYHDQKAASAGGLKALHEAAAAQHRKAADMHLILKESHKGIIGNALLVHYSDATEDFVLHQYEGDFCVNCGGKGGKPGRCPKSASDIKADSAHADEVGKKGVEHATSPHATADHSAQFKKVTAGLTHSQLKVVAAKMGVDVKGAKKGDALAKIQAHVDSAIATKGKQKASPEGKVEKNNPGVKDTPPTAPKASAKAAAPAEKISAKLRAMGPEQAAAYAQEKAKAKAEASKLQAPAAPQGARPAAGTLLAKRATQSAPAGAAPTIKFTPPKAAAAAPASDKTPEQEKAAHDKQVAGYRETGMHKAADHLEATRKAKIGNGASAGGKVVLGSGTKPVAGAVSVPAKVDPALAAKGESHAATFKKAGGSEGKWYDADVFRSALGGKDSLAGAKAAGEMVSSGKAVYHKTAGGKQMFQVVPKGGAAPPPKLMEHVSPAKPAEADVSKTHGFLGKNFPSFTKKLISKGYLKA